MFASITVALLLSQATSSGRFPPVQGFNYLTSGNQAGQTGTDLKLRLYGPFTRASPNLTDQRVRLYVTNNSTGAFPAVPVLPKGNWLLVAATNTIIERPVFAVSESGGTWIYDYLMVWPDSGGLNNVPAAMFSVRSDLGPAGVTLAVANNLTNDHDFAWFNAWTGATFAGGTRRFTLGYAGNLVFGTKVVGNPALKPNGATLEVRTGDDSAYTGISSTVVKLNPGVTSGTPSCGTCDSSSRGTFCYVGGTAGVKDIAQVCAKDAADAYAWRTIY